MAQELETALSALVNQFNEKLQSRGFDHFTPDADWPSPCELEIDGKAQWNPVLQKEVGESNNFDNVASAMGITLDPQFVEYFTLYFSDNIAAQHQDGVLEFLQPWSQDDFLRLQQNLIGHLMMKQRLKQAPTLFFALTDEEDLNLVINNTTGEVCLEYVGKEPHKVVSPNLVSFIKTCTPV